MLYSLAVLAKNKSWQLEFFVDHIPENLLANPRGNYADALALGARIIEFPKHQAKVSLARYAAGIAKSDPNTIFVPEGGASSVAEDGAEILAKEICDWSSEEQFDNVKVMLPSGTGTMAYYLQKHLPFEVLTCACVGGPDYLRRQMLALEQKADIRPTILRELPDECVGSRKLYFGKPHKALYDIWSELRSETGVEFDLLYDPLGWLYLIKYLDDLNALESRKKSTILYLHQGGLRGNQSMLPRYQREFG